MKKDKFIGPLRSITFDPPTDDCGYFGVVLKPKWMPLPLAYLFRAFLPIQLGWLNRQNRKYSTPDDWWFIYPSGDSFNKDGSKAKAIRVEPFLWCSRKTHYRVRVTFLGGSPFNCNVEPTNEYNITK
jgi:hypothetical protein